MTLLKCLWVVSYPDPTSLWADLGERDCPTITYCLIQATLAEVVWLAHYPVFAKWTVESSGARLVLQAFAERKDVACKTRNRATL